MTTATITDTLRQCHAIVWQHRADLEPYWPTPTTEDALLFAFTELGEAIDAHLRTNGDYARNRDKSLDVLDELSDAALMIITALEDDFPPSGVNGSVLLDKDKRSFQEIGWNLSMALVKQQDRLSWQAYAYFALVLIYGYPGMDLPARLTARLERIKAKRLAPPTIAVNDAYEQRKIAHESETP